jgi:DNA polymerase III subunit alpha
MVGARKRAPTTHPPNHYQRAPMIKIVSRKSLGLQPVYDIGVERSHNFLLDRGTIASNCFNKSHSTAYAYVTYQTAFLKANYPAEYMSALLTANSGDQDKVTKYLNNCEQTLNIKVEPPDINRSVVNFQPIISADRPNCLNILFGLSAIKNVGEGAIEAILNARTAGGEFTSIADLCQRVSLQSVNKRTLECLIQCGALDRLNPNRRQLVNDLEVLIPWSQKRAKEKEMGQGNLFDLLGGNDEQVKDGGFEAEPKTPTVEDYSSGERLQFEQELLGVYVSDHPLKSAEKYARYQKIEFIKVLDAPQHNRKKVNLVVLITELKPVQTKKDNKSMAILKLSDITNAKLEAVVFPQAYENIRDLLAVNTPIILSGKIGKKPDNDEFQLMVDEAIAIDPDFNFDLAMDLPIDPRYIVKIDLPLLLASDESKLHELQTLLSDRQNTETPPTTPVYAVIIGETQSQLVKLGQSYWVGDPDSAIAQIRSLGYEAEMAEETSVK